MKQQDFGRIGRAGAQQSLEDCVAGTWICQKCRLRVDKLGEKKPRRTIGPYPGWWLPLPGGLDALIYWFFSLLFSPPGRRETSEYDRYDRPDCPSCKATGAMQFYDLPPSKESN